MKLSKITVQSYQGINHFDLDVDQPILLVCGKNATGKSSLRDAVRFALTAESDRVKLKKEYPALVRLGANPKDAKVSVTLDGFTWVRSVASGEASTDLPDVPLVLPFLLGHSRFAELDRGMQTKILFNVTGVRADPETVKGLMKNRGIEPVCIEEVGPMLRAGFSKAHTFCKTKQTECRGAWKAITGENFGAKKAETWQAPPSDLNLDELNEQKGNLEESLTELQKRVKEAQSDVNDFRQYEYGNSLELECPCCEAKLTMVKGALEKMEDAIEERPSVELMQKAKNELITAERELHTTEQLMGQVQGEINRAEHVEEERARATEQAAEWFKMFNWWGKAADALAADGIPLEIIQSAITPVNDRLAATCEATGWGPIKIHEDLSISYRDIPYTMCSESERWRTDTAIAETISALSGAKFFVLDRMDVLHPEERVALIQWLLRIKGEHDSIVVMATLKDRPNGMPEGIQSVWLNNGGSTLENAA